MKRILMLVTVALIMAALLVASAAPTFAGNKGHGHQAYKHCKPAKPGPKGC